MANVIESPWRSKQYSTAKMVNQGVNVLSPFDGMSCGQIALERAGIKIHKYYASEIDRYAMQITQKNYPGTVQLGNVEFVTKAMLGDNKIDLLIGGSPCQGLSFAGKQLNFDDPRSKMFFEYVRLKKEFNPTYFLLENVRMKKESEDVISEMLGVEPIRINSALVSAQNRVRLYWTNIPGIIQPDDKGLYLKDIVEDAAAIVFGGAMRGRYDENGKIKQQLEANGTYKSNALTTVQKDSLCIQVGHANLKGHDFLKRVYSIKGKCPTLTAVCGGNQERKIALDDLYWRKLTPLECERLQTLPEGYTADVSNSQRYKMIGNGWTIDVIAHIFNELKKQIL